MFYLSKLLSCGFYTFFLFKEKDYFYDEEIFSLQHQIDFNIEVFQFYLNNHSNMKEKTALIKILNF
jgi:hypothetical protein